LHDTPAADNLTDPLWNSLPGIKLKKEKFFRAKNILEHVGYFFEKSL
jgi:hypothetical protein